MDGRNLGLDALRCAAIGAVVLSHGLGFLYPHVPPFRLFGFDLHLYHFGHLGSFGVELFFALSGFLIGGLLLRTGPGISRPAGLRRFYLRRWFRTLPNYYAFLVLNVIWFASLARALPYLAFTQNLWSERITFFPESWSLAVEEWFYLLFPALLAVLVVSLRRYSRAFLIAGGTLYLFSTVLRVVYACSPSNTWAEVMRIVVVLRFDALMTGIFAAWLLHFHPGKFAALRVPGLVVGLALIGFCYCTLYWNGAHNESFFARTFRFNLISLGFAALLPAAVAINPVRRPWNAPIGAIARWSYAMYFINLPLWVWLRGRFPQNQTVAREGWVAFATFIIGTVALSAVWYVLFERPTTRLRDRFPAASTQSLCSESLQKAQ